MEIKLNAQWTCRTEEPILFLEASHRCDGLTACTYEGVYDNSPRLPLDLQDTSKRSQAKLPVSEARSLTVET